MKKVIITVLVLLAISFVAYQGYKENEKNKAIAKEKAIQDAAIAREAERAKQVLDSNRASFERKAQQKVRELDSKRMVYISKEFKDEVKPLIDEATVLYNLTSSEKIKIQYNNLYIGMPTSLLFISWGVPSKVNRTTTARGENIQYVWSSYSMGSRYAYTEDGFVTSWQD